jgi:hypothetical protein
MSSGNSASNEVKVPSSPLSAGKTINSKNRLTTKFFNSDVRNTSTTPKKQETDNPVTESDGETSSSSDSEDFRGNLFGKKSNT